MTSRLRKRTLACLVLSALTVIHAPAQTRPYDLLLHGGHVIDDKNKVDSLMDVAISNGRIAKLAPHISSTEALKTIDVTGLYVTAGLIDLHVHVFAGTGEPGSYAGDESIYPDGFTFRNGVTTVVDAGSSGWRNFESFKQHVIDRSHTRVLAMLNIVGHGMRGDRYEQNTADMDGRTTALMARRYSGIIVGIKSAHFEGPQWTPIEQAVIAGNQAHVPVMIDFGADQPARPLYDLLNIKLRPGDIYTHMYSGLRHEQDPVTKGPSQAFIDGRKRGIFFDTGTGGGSFNWTVAIPMVKAGFLPDSISTDLHAGSTNSATKDMLNVASKMMAIGLSLNQVVADMTSHPAREIRHEELGNLSQGSIADIAVLRLEHGDFGYTDMRDTSIHGNQKLVCEVTIKDGKIVYDLNGRSAPPWNAPPDPHASESWRWTTLPPAQPPQPRH